MNRIGALVFSLGFSRHYAVALETRNPKSGKPVRIPIVVTPYAGSEYLVSMLGQHSYWVRNVRAASGRAIIVSGRQRAVILNEVPAELRAPILRAYLARAPGARPHIPINRNAPVASFEALASDYPVFEIRYSR